MFLIIMVKMKCLISFYVGILLSIISSRFLLLFLCCASVLYHYDCNGNVGQIISLSEKPDHSAGYCHSIFLKTLPDHCSLAVSIAPPGVCYETGYGPHSITFSISINY